MEIRRAVIGDLKGIQELNLMLFKKEYRESDKTLDLGWSFGKLGEKCVRERIVDERGCVFFAEIDGKIVGYLSGSEIDSEEYRKVMRVAEADDMFVLGEFRGKGIGGELHDAFIGWCRKRGVKLVKAKINASNEGSIGFHKKKGFVD